MNRILNTSEIVGTVELPQGEFEVCATADAAYHHTSNSMTVSLDATLRSVASAKQPQEVPVAWLPKRQNVTERVSIEEASDVARDIFKRWVRKVREAAPSLHAPKF